MNNEPVYLRFENTTSPHYKFYEIELELCLFYPKTLTRKWGRINTQRPCSLRTRVSNPDDLARWVKYLTRLRQHHGYHIVINQGLN